MRSIHPFPARMAPDAIADLLNKLPKDATIFDPMCGSGVVVRLALLSGRKAIGVDIDPLAALMSKVWTNKKSVKLAEDYAQTVAKNAASMKMRDVRLPWIDSCAETRNFVRYWFANGQRRDLRRLAARLWSNSDRLPAHIQDCLWLALSRTIVTKHSGASLAWDVSHSRPHKKRDDNDFPVFQNFVRAAAQIAQIMSEQELPRSGKIVNADCRNLSARTVRQVDAVITSPPYLNAIDYMRGHKLALAWMGYSMPELREIRGHSVGTERVGSQKNIPELQQVLEQAIPDLDRLPKRQREIVRKYAIDADKFLQLMRNVIAPGGKLITVLGNSNLRGCFVENSALYRHLALRHGFRLTHERERPLLANRRYLPTTSADSALAKRMGYEVIQQYTAAR